MRKMDLKEILDELKKRGYVLSMPRIAILRYVLKHRTHHTAESIYRTLKEEYPNLSIATVYNTLKLLSKEGFVRQLMIDESKVIYDSNADLHPHFLCKVCGKVEDVMLNFDLPVPDEVNGNRIDEVHVYLYGICKECMERIRKENPKTIH